MTLTKRVFNFNPGPGVLPESVLEKAQAELLDFQGTGMSVMEISHRAKEFVNVIEGAEGALRRLLGIPNDFEVLFLQGGASLQFSMIPMNLVKDNQPIDVLHTGYWTKKAIKEFERVAKVNIVASSEDSKFMKLPLLADLKFNPKASFAYMASNNTIYASQWPSYPNTGSVPLVADMTSDILSRKLDMSKFGMIFASSQKNLGPAGVVVAVIRKDLIERASDSIPTMLQYRTHAKQKSLYNTPPTFAIYFTGLVLEWIEKQGGVGEIEKQTGEKANILYDLIDKTDFYQCPVEKGSRSVMNVVFRIKGGDEDLEAKFVSEAKANNLIGLKGHRSVGGLRASLYIAQPLEAVQSLASFMTAFEKKHG